MEPGQSIQVKHPDGRVVSAVIPPGCTPGKTLHIQFPPHGDTVGKGQQIPVPLKSPNRQTYSTTTHTMKSPLIDNKNENRSAGVSQTEPSKRFKRCSEEMVLLNKKGLAKVRVPTGLSSGDVFKVRIADGRTVPATVPPNVQSGECFFIKVPPAKQNFHDNVLAVAPMTLGPLLI